MLNIVISAMCILDIAIAFIINKLSQTPFSLWKKENITLFVILIFLASLLIICNISITLYNKIGNPKKLQKAFQQSGGYTIAAQEMATCIKTGDVKKCKDIKKMLKVIEK